MLQRAKRVSYCLSNRSPQQSALLKRKHETGHSARLFCLSHQTGGQLSAGEQSAQIYTEQAFISEPSTG